MATITISFDVNDANQIILLENFNDMAEKQMQVNMDSFTHPYRIEPKKEGENDLQFGKRFIYETIMNAVKANVLNNDNKRYHEEVDNIAAISEDVPDTLLT